VIVPSAMKGQTIFHDVHRNLKHISVLACISAAGEHMTLLSQVNPTVERRLKSEAFRLSVDLISNHQNKLYMSLQLFAEYMPTVLLP
jgi:hypothetical protein